MGPFVVRGRGSQKALNDEGNLSRIHRRVSRGRMF